MRAAIFRGGDIVVDTLPEPVPAVGQALVKVLACGICGSDLHAAKHSHRMVEVSRRIPGRIPMDLDRDVVMGHEFCCEVIDYGPKTEKSRSTASGHFRSRENCRQRSVAAVLASQNGSRIDCTASAVPTSSVVVAAAQNDSTVSSS